jgi:hypothetical protein
VPAATSAFDLAVEDVTQATWTELTVAVLGDSDPGYDGENTVACDTVCDGCDSSTHHLY